MVVRSIFSFMNFSPLEISIETCKWQFFLCLPNSVAKKRHCVLPCTSHVLLLKEKVNISPFPTSPAVACARDQSARDKHDTSQAKN